MRKFAVFAIALLIFVVSAAEKNAKYVFLLIGDGMGPNVVKMYREQMTQTSFDKFGTPISTGTDNVFGKTTDSAASGTALACGIKTYNGALGVDKDGKPVKSLAKYLQERGMKIGIISSVGINDATPAAHYANRLKRGDAAGTLSDLFACGFDFFGVSSFKNPPELTEGLRKFIFKRNKYTVVDNRKLDALKKGNKNVFISNTLAGNTPSLSDVTVKAIELLDNPNGFFIMVEGGAIDHCNHRNNASSMMKEMAEFDKVIAAALQFAEKHPEETLIVVTADHDTGGIQLNGKVPVGFWKKSAMNYQSLDEQSKAMRKSGKSREEIVSFVCKNVGITLTEEGKKRIAPGVDRFMAGKKTKKGSMYGKYNPLVVAVFREFDAQNNYKYTTFNHTSTKVPTFTRGAGAKHFTAPLENSDIPHRISLAVTGKDLLAENKGAFPFPPSENKAHFTIQSVSKDTVVCRYNLGPKKSIKVVLEGNGKKMTKATNAAFGRITFDKLAPDTKYTVTVDSKKFNVKTLPALKSVAVKGAVLSDPHTSTIPDNPKQRMHSRSKAIIASARKAFDAAKIDVLLVPGDVTDRSFPGEFKAFLKTFQKTSYPVLTTPGNHDYLTKSNPEFYKKTFKFVADYRVINGIQIITLNTWDGKLNKPENIAAVNKLDITKPAIIQSHFQLFKSNIMIKDKNAAIKDSKVPEVKAMLDKISSARAVVFVGHKNSAERISIGKKAIQINAPQTTQYPAGFLMFEANQEGIAFWYVGAASEYAEEYSRRLAPFYNREKLAIFSWNSYFAW